MATHVLLASQPMADIAQRVSLVNSTIRILPISWRRFPDGYPDTFISDKDSLMGSHVTFLACFDSPQTIFEQVSVMYDLAESRPRSLRILLPYFPTGTMERKDHEGQVATASSLAHMLSAMAPAGPGPVPMYIWDIHALPIRHYFGPSVAPRFKTGIRLLQQELKGRDVTIVFPDEGAWKRFKVMFQNDGGQDLWPMAFCRKVRQGKKRAVVLAEGDVKGRETVIVDDLIHSGGTIRACRETLVANGATAVSAYSTHAVMENRAWDKFMGAGFETFWLTDSCPGTAAAVDGQGPFKVLSLAASFAEIVTMEDA